jgi:hypothetical protein
VLIAERQTHAIVSKLCADKIDCAIESLY